MWGSGIFMIPVMAVLGFYAWQILNWVWLKPKRIEKLMRSQGMKGNPYRFLFGDSKDTVRMYEEAFSKPINLQDDIVPRLMPNIYQAVQKFGNFCFTWAGPRPRVFIMDPDVAKSVLGNRHDFLKPFKGGNDTLKLMVTGLPVLEGHEWSKSRSMVNPMFRLDALKSMVSKIGLCCEETIKKFKEAVEKEGGSCVVDVFHHMEVVTSMVLAKLMFNCPYTDEVKEIFHQLDELGELSNLHVKIWSFPGEKYLNKTYRRAMEICNYVRSSITSMINERLKNRMEQEDETSNKDLMDVYIKELYEGKFSNNERQRIVEEAVGELKTYFFAGFEATSNLLTWSLVMLAYHQECQDRAREEVLRVLGNKEKITSDDVTQLKYITMVVNESLRLYSPAMEISRLVGKDVIIKGYKIPKDTLLTFPILMYHRNKEYWGEDAEEFRPERFVDGVKNAIKGEAAFIPFGWGPRICIGMNLSLIESKVMLAMLLREFSLEPSPTYTHAPIATFTVEPQFGAPLVLKKL